MYARGMSQRDISSTIEEIYGFSVSHDMVSDITDQIFSELEDWQARQLAKCYAFIFVDCMYVTLRENYEAKEYAVYTILGYDLKGNKEILGLWLNRTESKNRGFEDVFFISMDGVSGLEDGAQAISLQVVVQRCIVHLVRNALRYVPSKDYKKFCKYLKKFYGASSFKASHATFDAFEKCWWKYPVLIDVWKRNFSHVEQLFDYGSDIRKVMYTTTAVESVNSSFRKATKNVAFPNENALLKVLYLRVKELQNKWNGGHIRNWSMVLINVWFPINSPNVLKNIVFTYRNLNASFVR
ncbi:UNVERIFIED_ORG: transposase-like protein [Bacillus proteolyticus]